MKQILHKTFELVILNPQLFTRSTIPKRERTLHFPGHRFQPPENLLPGVVRIKLLACPDGLFVGGRILRGQVHQRRSSCWFLLLLQLLIAGCAGVGIRRHEHGRSDPRVWSGCCYCCRVVLGRCDDHRWSCWFD